MVPYDARIFTQVQIYSRTYVAVDTLSHNAQVGVVTNTPLISNFSVNDLSAAQRYYDTWAKVINE